MTSMCLEEISLIHRRVKQHALGATIFVLTPRQRRTSDFLEVQGQLEGSDVRVSLQTTHSEQKNATFSAIMMTYGKTHSFNHTSTAFKPLSTK